jgi:hypothetical protein
MAISIVAKNVEKKFLLESSLLARQIVPLVLTVVVFFALSGALFLEILILNRFTAEDILTGIRFIDILVGLTIYLKTSIDFAIYIGRLMNQNPGWKSRVAIEIGTALGNAAGTLAILAVWTFFKEVRWLLAAMVFLASLVLFKLAEDSLEHAKTGVRSYPGWFGRVVSHFEYVLDRANRLVFPILRHVVPNLSISDGRSLPFWRLAAFSFTIPFILGLDDFAGYVPLFSVVNVFGFAIGVFAGHMILNIFLYISPDHTIRVVKNPVLSFLGSVAFVGLGIWGLIEVGRLIGT